MKSCTKCRKPKPLAEFHRDKRSRDGRTSACRLCMNRVSKAYHATKRQEASEDSENRATPPVRRRPPEPEIEPRLGIQHRVLAEPARALVKAQKRNAHDVAEYQEALRWAQVTALADIIGKQFTKSQIFALVKQLRA